ncbi:MAG: carboxymuconolactone decarboxylase family protein [Betaproteobacteria bacterium]|jgi:4-carboxymuconolactone decarboxylase|nr:carboxymuconolactone decarboxylase family protein [Betaproteobacteria bacterium]
MARVPYVDREQMDAEGQEIYDRIRRDRNAPQVGLQFRALLHNPKAAGYLTSMGAQLRFQSAIPENLKELAIIVVAREWNSDIEWTAHAALAAKAGVSPATIEALRTNKSVTGFSDQETTIVRFVHELLRQKRVSDETFAAAQNLLGVRGVVDLTLTCGYYTAINMAQIALKPEMEAGRTSTL